MSRVPHWVAVGAALLTLLLSGMRAATLPPANTPGVESRPAAAPPPPTRADDFAADEDGRGRIDVSDVLGDGWYLADVTAPRRSGARRLLAVYVPGQAGPAETGTAID
jgi:hypothetical protein